MGFYEQLKIRLDAVHTWPSLYLFKFVIPKEKRAELLAIMPTGMIEEKLSRTGKYVSISLKTRIKSSDDVIVVYEEAAKIEGIISL
ncbi:MAG: DUF493 family protein [Proteobacteria bacterium]|nr:DUF493 family protein [Pseudomonadota bacterium]